MNPAATRTGDDKIAKKPGRMAARLIAEPTVVFFILLNTFSLTAIGFTEQGSPWEKLWFGIDYLCVLYFVIEAVLKIRSLGFKAYWSRGLNRFDFLVTLFSAPTLLTPFLGIPRLSGILVLRLSRLLRLFRALRFIPNREHLAKGVSRALRTSAGVIFALIVVNLILALGATFLFGELAPEHFGNPARSIYSLFRVFTVEGWYEIPDLLAERTDSDFWAVAARVYFVLAVLIGGILGLSLANAVFVDEMTMDNNQELENRLSLLTEEVRALRRELGLSAGQKPPDPDLKV